MRAYMMLPTHDGGTSQQLKRRVSGGGGGGGGGGDDNDDKDALVKIKTAAKPETRNPKPETRNLVRKAASDAADKRIPTKEKNN